MNSRIFLGLFAALILTAAPSGPSVSSLAGGDREASGTYRQYGTGDYFNKWPNPMVGDRASHYPPYHENSH